MDPLLLEKSRDELAVQKKIGEAAADTSRLLQAEVTRLKSEALTQKDVSLSREVQYLTQQREELQMKLDGLLLQQSHWQEQQEQWREKEKQRKVRPQLLPPVDPPPHCLLLTPSLSLCLGCACRALSAQLEEQHDLNSRLQRQMVRKQIRHERSCSSPRQPLTDTSHATHARFAVPLSVRP